MVLKFLLLVWRSLEAIWLKDPLCLSGGRTVPRVAKTWIFSIVTAPYLNSYMGCCFCAWSSHFFSWPQIALLHEYTFVPPWFFSFPDLVAAVFLFYPVTQFLIAWYNGWKNRMRSVWKVRGKLWWAPCALSYSHR